MPTDKWEALAERINARLDELAWDQIDLVRESGVNDKTIRQLQTGAQVAYRGSTLAKVSRALGWDAQAIKIMLAGDADFEGDSEPDPYVPYQPAAPSIAGLGERFNRLSPERRARLLGYLERLMEEQDGQP